MKKPFAVLIFTLTCLSYPLGNVEVFKKRALALKDFLDLAQEGGE